MRLTRVQGRSGAPAVRRGHRRDVWQRRTATLVQALEPGADDEQAVLARHLDGSSAQATWLALAVLTARVPDATTTQAVTRAARWRGAEAVMAAAAEAMGGDTHEVRVARDEVLVDVGDLLEPEGTDDLSRVLRSALEEWRRTHSPTLVGWGDGADQDRLLDVDRHEVVVPWHSTVVLPRLCGDVRQTRLTQAIALFARSRTAAVAGDAAPLTSADDVPGGAPSQYANALAAMRHVDRVMTLSQTSAGVLGGWRTMLRAIALPGPEVGVVPLTSALPEPAAEDLEEARDRFALGDFPVVINVSDRASRPHRRTVLHAAEILWREGKQFTMSFIGQPATRDLDFERSLTRLQREGRPVEIVGHVSDQLLAAAYRIARCSVVPTTDDASCVPVAESLSVGTPVVASRFGAAAELAAGGGALTVDPRDHHDVSLAMRRMLSDEPLYRRLRVEAAERVWTAPSASAAQAWEFLTGGGRPGR